MLYILTLDEMKDALGIKDSEDDAQVTVLLEGLQGRFDAYCNRRFLYASDIEEIFDGDQQWLLVRAFPIDEVASIHIDENQLWDEVDLLDETEYRINKPRGRIVYGTGLSKWPDSYQGIRLVYCGGLIREGGTAAPGADTSDVESLRRAVRIQANFEWRNKQNLGASNVSVAGVSLALAKAELLPDVKSILDGLKRY